MEESKGVPKTEGEDCVTSAWKLGGSLNMLEDSSKVSSELSGGSEVSYSSAPKSSSIANTPENETLIHINQNLSNNGITNSQ